MLQAFFEANPTYFESTGGQPPQPGEALAEINDRPPAGMPHGRVWALGFVDAREQLVAMAGVVENLIAAGVWHIGLFIVATERHGKGDAQQLHAAILAWARAHGAQWMRLGVVAGNARAQAFWRRCGYVELREREGIAMGRLVQSVRVMVKPLAHRSVEHYLERVERDRPGSTLP